MTCWLVIKSSYLFSSIQNLASFFSHSFEKGHLSEKGVGAFNFFFYKTDG